MASARFRTIINACCLAAALAAGCQREMGEHGRIRPLQGDGFFADGSSARLPVKGTVARGAAPSDDGRTPGGYAQGYPVPLDETFLAAGHEGYRVYCGVCHGPQGAGDGMVVRRGFTRPRSFMLPELLAAPPGYYVYAAAHGFGTMDAFRDLVGDQERWAIAAYIKERLQRPRRPRGGRGNHDRTGGK